MITEREKNKIKNYFLITQGLDIKEVTEFHGYLLLKPYGALNFKDKIYQDKTIKQELIINSKDISDLSPLLGLTNLIKLDLWNSFITDISSLSSLTNLKTLSLGLNNFSDISSLSSLTNLIDLYLWDNKITNISPLSNLHNLEILYLHGNNISDISALASISNLKVLNIRNNFLLKKSQIDQLKLKLPCCDIRF
jgi:Leucine-rich repeat (LRR) protein